MVGKETMLLDLIPTFRSSKSITRVADYSIQDKKSAHRTKESQYKRELTQSVMPENSVSMSRGVTIPKHLQIRVLTADCDVTLK